MIVSHVLRLFTVVTLGIVVSRWAMTSGRLFLIAMIIATFVSPAARSQNGQPAAQIWVGAFSAPVRQRVLSDGWRKDAPDQWKPEAPWPTVAARTKVAWLVAGNMENTSDADLKAVIEDVKRRHLELALSIGPLVRSAECAPAGGDPAGVSSLQRTAGPSTGGPSFNALLGFRRRTQSGTSECLSASSQLRSMCIASYSPIPASGAPISVCSPHISSRCRPGIACFSLDLLPVSRLAAFFERNLTP